MKRKRTASKQRISGIVSHWLNFYHGNKQGRSEFRGKGRQGHSSSPWNSSSAAPSASVSCVHTCSLANQGNLRLMSAKNSESSDPVKTIPHLLTVWFLGWPVSHPFASVFQSWRWTTTMPLHCPLFPLEQNCCSLCPAQHLHVDSTSFPPSLWTSASHSLACSKIS